MRPLALAFLSFFSLQTIACGICVDDKVASAYDHGVVAGAKARGDAVAFLAIEGPLARSAETRGAVLRAIRSAGGVQRASARVSLESAALSFAYDPRRASVDAIRATLDGRLAPQGLKLRLLREMR
jgi:hypothetical protein